MNEFSEFGINMEPITAVFTDSRGRNLDAYIDMQAIQVKAFSGAKLRNIVHYSYPYVKELRPCNILFIGGTCDISVENHVTRHIRPRFLNSHDLLQYMRLVLNNAHEYAVELFPESHIGFGGLCGVSLSMYNRQPGTDRYQGIKDDMIDQFNFEIKSLNIQNGLIHPTLTSKIHKRNCHGNRNQYYLFYDGVHPGHIVLKDWARNIVRFHNNNLG